MSARPQPAPGRTGVCGAEGPTAQDSPAVGVGGACWWLPGSKEGALKPETPFFSWLGRGIFHSNRPLVLTDEESSFC